MRGFGLLTILALFGIPGFSAAELVYTPVPVESSETVVAAHTPLVRYLSGRLGTPIRIHFEQDHETIQRQFIEGKIDLVQLGPIPFLTLKKAFPQIEPVLVFNEPDGKPTYTCAMVTSFDGPASIKELTGSVALPQHLSTCGHFSAGMLLEQAEIDIDRLPHAYLGNQTNVALAVLRGEYKVGTLKTAVARKYETLTLRILKETPPFPGFVLAVNTTRLKREQIEKIRELLATATAETRSGWIAGNTGFSPVAEKDFDLLAPYLRFAE